MNTKEEIRQLSTNLIVKCGIRIKPAQISEKVERIKDDVQWSLEEYKAWFFEQFGFSKQSIPEPEGEEPLGDGAEVTALPEQSTGGAAVTDAAPTSDTDVIAVHAGTHSIETPSPWSTHPLIYAAGFLCIGGGISLVICAAASGNTSNAAEIAWYVLGTFLVLLGISFSVIPAGHEHPEIVNSEPIISEPMSNEPVPEGCQDYIVNDQGTPMESATRGHFRCAGNTHMQFGFQLTNDPKSIGPQLGQLICLEPLSVAGCDVCVGFEYVMHGTEGQSDGLAVCLMDPSVEGWDRLFDGLGPLGLQGKTGAILAVGFDLTGHASGGSDKANSITIQQPCEGGGILHSEQMEGPLTTGETQWREVHIKINADQAHCSIVYQGQQILDTCLAGVSLPPSLGVAVFGAAKDAQFLVAVNCLTLTAATIAKANAAITEETATIPEVQIEV